jgi:4-aminobutyrate aminotransferase
LATLELLENGYISNAAERGEQLRQGLLKLQRQHPNVGDVRGLGLMMAMDLIKGGEPGASATGGAAPDPALRDAMVQTAFQQGLLLLGCGDSAIRFCPPLCISSEQVETALHILGGILAARKPEKLAV